MRVGYLQFRPLFGRPDRNLRTIVRALRDAEADLVVLPELALSGYYFADRGELRELAEDPRSSPRLDSLVALCRERDFQLAMGFAERARDKLFNSCVLLGPHGVVGSYRKLHLFDEEQRWFDPGDLPLRTHGVHGVRIGMMVCFDWVFPEVTRTLALRGMDVLLHPANLVLDHCQRVMLARCLENSVFAITANRFGEDRRPHGRLRFTGRSQIVGPRGELLHRAPAQRSELHVREIDPARARDKHITPRNDLLRDRRPEFYES